MEENRRWVIQRYDSHYLATSRDGTNDWVTDPTTPYMKLFVSQEIANEQIETMHDEHAMIARRMIDVLDELAKKRAPERGMKLDDGKLDYSLVPVDVEAEFVAVLSYGAVKYERDNWMKVPDARNRYVAALRRHVAAFVAAEKTGAVFDEETSLHHLAHAMCCTAFLLGLDLDRLRGSILAGEPLEVRFQHALGKAREIRAKREKKER